MLDITTIYLEDNTIKYIEYGKVSRDNNASNILRVVSNYPLDYTVGISFVLPNGRNTLRYKLLSDLPAYEKLEDPHKIEITQDIIDKYASEKGKILDEIIIQSGFKNKIYSGRASKIRNFTVNINTNIITVYLDKSTSGKYEVLKFEENNKNKRKFK